MKIFIKDKLLLSDVRVANNPWIRFKGLMFTSNSESKNGLFIPNCNWIHTLFMRYPIDVVYLDANYKVVDVDSVVKPWRMCMPRFKAKHILELSQGSINNSLSTGEVLKCIA